MLKCVTISGADDNVGLWEMVEISRRFPFVEWGILISPKYERPRYPSLNHIKMLTEHFDGKKSLHLCGDFARNFATKRDAFDSDIINGFDRVQINLSKEVTVIDANVLAYNISQCEVNEFMFQMKPDSEFLLNLIRSRLSQGKHLIPFIDISGGTGAEGVWKPEFYWNGWYGFAGGIGPDNIKQVLEETKDIKQDFWIDMESKVRDENNNLNLDAVKNVLSICEQYVQL